MAEYPEGFNRIANAPSRPGAAVMAAPQCGEVPSPCVNICRMDEVTGWCVGCQRTLSEIAAWSTMGAEAKREVWAQLPRRRGPEPAPPLQDKA